MTRQKIPVFKTVKDTFLTLTGEWRLVLAVSWLSFTAYLLTQTASAYLDEHLLYGPKMISQLIFPMAGSLLLAPAAIAIHRFVLLGERASSFTHWRPSRRLLKYAFYSFLLEQTASCVLIIALDNDRMLTYVSTNEDWITLTALAIVIAIIVLSLYIIVKFSLILPAISIDHKSFGLRHARRAIKANGWRYLAGISIILLPYLLIIMLLFAILGTEPHGVSPSVLAFFLELAELPLIALCLIFDACVYRLLVQKTDGSAASPALPVS